MKADLVDLNKENIKNFCFDYLNNVEMEAIARNSNLRSILLTCDLPIRVQENLNYYNDLSLDECISIIENSTEIFYKLYYWHQYDIELLRKHADKLDLNNIQDQKCLDADFVQKYIDRIDVIDFVNKRVDFGDIHQFLNIKEIAHRYFCKSIKFSVSRAELVDFISTVKPNVDRTVSTEFIDALFNRNVNLETLAEDYADQVHASHTVTAVTNFFKNHSNMLNYETWEDYVRECKTLRSTALADVWFDDFYRRKILQFIGIELEK